MRPASSAQSHLRFPLSRLLGSGSAIRVLRALGMRDTPLSIPQLANECGLTKRGIHLIVQSLVEQQVVTMLGSGKVQLYHLDKSHPLAESLRTLFRDEQTRWLEFLGAVRAVLGTCPAVSSACYYGSVARAEDGPQSDFDIVIVTTEDACVEETVDGTRQALRPVEDRFYVTCSVVGLSCLDVVRLHRTEDDWWNNVERDAKVLKGPGVPEYLRANMTQVLP